jgi:hypothetical protein
MPTEEVYFIYVDCPEAGTNCRELWTTCEYDNTILEQTIDQILKENSDITRDQLYGEYASREI